MTITFSIDNNQILNVTATVEENGSTKSIKINKKAKNLNEISTLQLGRISLIGNDLNKMEKNLN